MDTITIDGVTIPRYLFGDVYVINKKNLTDVFGCSTGHIDWRKRMVMSELVEGEDYYMLSPGEAAALEMPHGSTKMPVFTSAGTRKLMEGSPFLDEKKMAELMELYFGILPFSEGDSNCQKENGKSTPWDHVEEDTDAFTEEFNEDFVEEVAPQRDDLNLWYLAAGAAVVTCAVLILLLRKKKR